MDRSVEAIKAAILAHGLDDWVHIAEVVFVARRAQDLSGTHVQAPAVSGDRPNAVQGERLAQAEREALPLGITAVKELLRGGLVRIGETTTNGFMAWEGSTEEIEDRIDGLVREAQYPLLPGHLFWLENTPSGDEVAGASDG